VDTRHFFAVVGEREGERELGYPLGFGAGDDLEGFDDAGNRLVL
jgi:hypothetical protein